MDSLLNYWRRRSRRSATIIAGYTENAGTTMTYETNENEDIDVENDDGPFFDLELTTSNGVAIDSEQKVNFNVAAREPLSSETSSLYEDKFFNAKVAPLDANNNDGFKTESSVSFLKRATMYRVLTLRIRKPNHDAGVELETSSQKPQRYQNRFFKFKVEIAPAVSLFTRDHRSLCSADDDNGGQEDKKFANEPMRKYLNKVKPRFYIRVSKRSVDKQNLVENNVQMDDGIQSAIAHCKRSLTSAGTGVGDERR